MATTFGCIYKTLIACASDNKGRSILYDECYVLHCSNTFASNQIIVFVISSICTLPLYSLIGDFGKSQNKCNSFNIWFNFLL